MDAKAFGAGGRGQAVHFRKVWVYQTGVPLRCSCCMLGKMASVALWSPCDCTQQHSPLERPSLWRLQALGVVSPGPLVSRAHWKARKPIPVCILCHFTRLGRSGGMLFHIWTVGKPAGEAVSCCRGEAGSRGAGGGISRKGRALKGGVCPPGDERESKHFCSLLKREVLRSTQRSLP